MKKSKSLLIILIFCPGLLFSQLFDDFSDGDFISNPQWAGDTSHFEINSSNKLHLKSAGADTSYLSTVNSLVDSCEWIFIVKQSFNSSANNHARIYLFSDNPNLKGPLNGYFLQIGGSNDSIAFYRQDGNIIHQLSICSNAFTGNSTNQLTIKVIRDDFGNWEIFSDPNATDNFQTEAVIFDNIHSSGSYFGIFCKYTSSNSTKFYFDDFLIQNIYVDTVSPELEYLKTLSSFEIELGFSEAMDKSSAEDINNFIVDKGIGNPSISIFDSNMPSIVHLVFSTIFNNGELYNIDLSGIKDISDNEIISSSYNFAYYIPQTFDILINEIMADPDPLSLLPPDEYIELYNRTLFPLNLEGWTIYIGSTAKQIPEIQIQAGAYHIFSVENSFLSEFGPFTGFSSFSITNSGQRILLKDNFGKLIHTVCFNEQWYDNNLKAEGGWSIEMIDCNNPCGEKDNWRASIDQKGGSPGMINSVADINPDNISPAMFRTMYIDSVTINLIFNEQMDINRLLDTSIFEIDNGMGYPLLVEPYNNTFRAVKLKLKRKIMDGIIYTINIKDTVRDCSGNIIPAFENVQFGKPENAAKSDIVINEILFNPRDGGVDFVEIYNRSTKVIDLKNLVIGKEFLNGTGIEEIKNISYSGFLALPGRYYVLCTEPHVVRQHYFSPDSRSYPDSISSFPAYKNDEGIVIIANKATEDIIDRFHYNEDMHFALLNSTKGVSLERISYDRPTDDATNWHSASENVGFASPGNKNSQFVSSHNLNSNISIDPKIFSPDNDGHNDVANIHYKFDKAGNIANICIYDAKGILVRKLSNNELLSTRGTISWDGINERGGKAKTGIYVIFSEIFNMDGDVRRSKNILVLGSRL